MAMKLTKSELEALRKSVAPDENRNAMSKEQLNSYRKKAGENWMPIEYYKKDYNLTAGGMNFGKVSYDAYKAIENNALDSYTPKNEEEKKAITDFSNYPSIPFAIEIDGEVKDFGKISPNAYKAVENGTIEDYISTNDNEKKAIDDYINFSEEYAKKQREPESFGQGFLHSVGYTAEKFGSGVVNVPLKIGGLLEAGVAKLLTIPATGKAEQTLEEYAGKRLNIKTIGDQWSESAESRYRIPDWYREIVGPAVQNAAELMPAVLAEGLTKGASPMLEAQVAAKAAMTAATKSATKKALAKSISTKLIKPKVSDVVFGLGATASAAKTGYAQTGDVGKALNYGILNGLGELATERLFGGIGGLGGDDVFELIDVSKIKGLSKLASTKYGKKVLDIAFEGVEEVIMRDLDPWIQKATINPDANVLESINPTKSKFWEDRGESFFQGMLLSGLMNAGTYAVGKTANFVNKTKAIKELNKSIKGINSTLPSDVTKFEPLKFTSTVEEVNGRYADVERVKAINKVNGAINGINAIIKSNESKISPLRYDSTIEEIEQAQIEIMAFAGGYADLMAEELSKSNPEVFADIEKISVGDSFKDTKTGNVITVVGRDDKNTTVEIDNGEIKSTRVFSNAQADSFATSEQLVETEDTSFEISPTTEQVVNNEGTATPTTPKPIHLTRVGNNYDIYGEEAVEFANALGVEIKKEMVNGVERDVLRLPADIAEAFADAVSDEYNLIMSDKVTTEAENAPTASENATTNETTSLTKTNAREAENSAESVATKKSSVNVGDVYENKEHSTTYTIVSRDDKNTTYTTRYSSGHTSTSTTDNLAADILFEYDDSLQKIKNGNAATTTKVENSAKVLQNEFDSATIKSKTEESSVEREENSNEQGRTDLLYGDGKRGNNGGSQKQTERLLSFRRGNQGKNATERANFARELIERGQVEEVNDKNARYNLVKPDAYNDDMLAMVEDAKRRGVELRFFVGRMEVEIELDDGTKVTKLMSGLALPSTQVAYVQYDDTVESPQQIYKHELCHTKWYTPEMQKIKDTILDSLTEADKQNIKQTQRFKDYMAAYKNREAICWEEFVCDVMSGKTEYTANFIDTVYDYWYGNESVDSYNPADYTTSTDAGGTKTSKSNNDGKRWNIAEEGNVEDEKTRDNRKRTNRVSDRIRNQERRHSGNTENISNGDSKSEIQSSGGRLDGRGQTTGKGSRVGSVDGVAPTSSRAFSPGRTGTDRDRFLVALKKGDKKTARTILNRQAVRNGFVPAHMYHGTLSDDVFTRFESEVGIHWVTPSLKYAKNYTDGYYGDNIKAEQLFTKPDSGVYDLYIKPGKILDVGDINLSINTLNDIYDFGKQIGFSKEEINRCWNEGRVYGYRQLWTIVHTSAFAKIAREYGYDSIRATERDGVQTYGCLYPENLKSAKLKTFDDDGQLIPLEERFSKKDDIRYNLADDSDGNTLTEAQQEYFKDSKVRDENGNLLVMYQGSVNDFTIFDRNKSSYTNLYGRGFYFTKSEAHASRYGNTRAYYLDIKHPVSTTETTITKAQLRKFLQAVTDNEDYSFENYGYGATVDSVLESVYGKSDFLMLNDVSQTAIGDLVEAIELFNEINGTDYDGIVLDTETVTFNSEQAKLTSNKKPTSNPDTRFNLAAPIEETKDLVAVHNISPSKLLKALKLGGLPMPSIAVVKAEDGHLSFGEISLVFGKETIDPQFMKRNKVYSGDAWTPTYPQIEYKVNEKAQKRIREKINGLVPKNIQDDLGGLHLDSSNIENDLNRNGDVVTSYRYNDAMKYAFLRDYDVNIELPTKDEPFVRYGQISNDAVISFAHKMVDGLKSVNSLLEQHSSKLMADTELINIIADVLNDEVLETVDKNTEEYRKLVENPLYKSEDIDFSTILDMLEGARKYFNANGKAEKKIDYRGAREKIDDYFNSNSLEKEYEYWLKKLFSDIVDKEGIRNNKDLFTPSGNRRSFEALHYEHSLENVIKAMTEQGDKGVGAFGGGNILGAATTEYGSIADIKTDAQKRMEQIPESQYDRIKKGFTDRLFELACSLPIHKDSFSAIDSAANMLIEAVSKYKTKSGMANYLRKESQGWANYNDSVVDDLIQLVSDIRQMPVSYFEAKPQRAVGFDEVKAVIMPKQSSFEDDLSEITKLLNERNIPIIEYEYGFNDTRIKALNSLDDMRFNLSGEDADIKTQKQIESIAQEIGSHEELIATAKKNTQEFIGKIKENKSLQKRLHNAKRQMLLSPTPTVNATKVGKVTKEILKEMNSTIKAADLKDEVMSIYNEYFASIKKAGGVESKTQTANENMMRRFAELAVDIADSSEVFIESEDYMMIKSYVRNTRIKVPDWAKSDVDYAAFRKSHMGTLNLTNDGLDIDVAYVELCEMFPGIFDAELTSPSEQLLEIANTIEKLKPYAYNPNTGFMQEAIDHIVFRFVSEADGLAAAPKTKAQKIAEKGTYDKEVALEKEREAFERKFEKQKKDSETLIRSLQKKIDDAKYVRYWEKRLDKEEKAQAIKELRERRNVAVLKSQIRNIVSDMRAKLNKTEKANGYPKELVKAVADVCSALDFHTGKIGKDGSATKVSLKLDALKAEYDALKNNPNYDFRYEYDDGLSEHISNLYEQTKDKRIVDLSAFELSNLKDILREIQHRLSVATKQIGLDKARENLEIGTEIINDLNKNDDLIDSNKKQLSKEISRLGSGAKAFVLNPHRIFEMIAGYNRKGAWWNLYDQLNRGVRKSSKFKMDATKPFDELTSGNGGNEVAFFDYRTKKYNTGIKYTDGSEVMLPKSMICELVMAWERKQGRNHLETGGAKIPDIDLYNKGLTSTAMTEGSKRTVPITQTDMTRLKAMLDSYDLEWIEKARHLFNDVSQKAINETSMELVGREIARAENYIRLYVDKDFVKTDIEGIKVDASLEGSGSLKATVQNAKQPIVLRGLHENVYEQIDFVSKYYGLAIPIRNFNKVYNIAINNNNGDLSSVKEVIGKKFGSKIQKGVVEQLIRDLQSPREKNFGFFTKVRGNWLNATFWGNIRSALKQTTSYWTASAVVDEDSLVKGLANYIKHPKLTKAEIERYTGSLYKREQGLSTTELGERAARKRLAGASNKITKAINEHARWLRKVPEGIRPENWLQTMDCTTATALWEACKLDVAKTVNASEEGYWKAVTDLYDRVIEETQSNYDLMHRPEALKNTNPITQTVTMFQTDNLQQTGLLYSAYNDLKTKDALYKEDESSTNEQAYNDAKRRFVKAVRGRLYSMVWLALATMAGNMLLRKFNPYRDDEENDITTESVLKRLMLSMGEDLFGVLAPVAGNLMMQLADAWNYGYDFASVPEFDVIQEFIESTSKVFKAFMDDNEDGTKSEKIKKALLGIVPSASNLTGIPAKNITDWFSSIKGYAGDIKEGDFVHDIENYAGSRSLYTHRDLASAIVSGDSKQEQKILDYYSNNNKTINNGSLTKEIKAAYVQILVDNPTKAAAVKKKLILDYDYKAVNIDAWVYDIYLDKITSDTEYAEEIKAASKWEIAKFDSVAEARYKEVYKSGEEKDIEDLRNVLVNDCSVSNVKITTWEREVEKANEKKQKALDAEKEKIK